jgi:precorrin-3B synthase
MAIAITSIDALSSATTPTVEAGLSAPGSRGAEFGTGMRPRIVIPAASSNPTRTATRPTGLRGPASPVMVVALPALLVRPRHELLPAVSMVSRAPPYRGCVSRSRDEDACPGALQVHQAADGALARIRLPGGMISAVALEALADAAGRLGNGTLEFTARGNLQIRGIHDPGADAAAVAAAGLLPSATHERVRNIVASPLSGRVGGLADVRPWVRDLDDAIQAAPDLARLPGRFWFSLDDGTGDVSGLAADVGGHVLERTDAGVALLLAGRDTGVRMSRQDLVPTLIAVARRFVDIRGHAWRVSELACPDALLSGFVRSTDAGRRFPPARPPVGWIDQDQSAEVTLGAVVPLGVLSARQAQFVAAVGAPVVITPWRSLLLCDLSDGVADTALRVLAPLGLVFDDTSPWLAVSACVGSPGCERSRADVRAEATQAVSSGASRGVVHYVGCERACGSPLSGTVLVATGEGYQPLPRPTVG